MKKSADPLISVILPVHNGEKYLSKSVRSVLEQTYPHLELIIVNDCSSDSTLKIAETFQEKDKRVRIINNERNLKLPASLNRGHMSANGSLLTWTSDDNMFEPEALSRMAGELSATGSDIAYTDMTIIDESDNEMRLVTFGGIEENIFGNHIGGCFLYKAEVFNSLGGYNEQLFLVEDYDFWLRALRHFKFVQIHESLYKYRRHGGTLTSAISKDPEQAKLWEKNIRKMFSNFCESFDTTCKDTSNYLADIHMNKSVLFEEIAPIHPSLISFQEKLLFSVNFDDYSVKQIFLRHLLAKMHKERKNRFSNIRFVVVHYRKVLDMRNIKTLLVYFFGL